MSFFPWQGRLQAPGDLLPTFHLISIRPGQNRGHHLYPGQVRERVISGDRTLIRIPPGLAHAVTNPGPELLYLLAWREVSGPGPGDPKTIPHTLSG